MTDRELLEKAARAAGLQLWTHEDGGLYLPNPMRRWSPLEDDGDALRLAVELKIDLHFERNGIADQEFIVEAMFLYDEWRSSCRCFMEILGDDPQAAVRRVITRAAAAIGEGMK